VTIRFKPRIAILNPNSTERMTTEMVETAHAAVGAMADVVGMTNDRGPASIQGPADVENCLDGLFALFEEACRRGVKAIVIGCFDDTGLGTLRASGKLPVIGLGEAGCIAGSLAARRFSVVTSLDVSIPVIEDNIRAMQLADRCAGVHASGVPVLEINAGQESLCRVQASVNETAASYPGSSIVLGCGGMTSIARRIKAPQGSIIVDPVVASAHLCLAALS
jgi:allantoin racemase